LGTREKVRVWIGDFANVDTVIDFRKKFWQGGGKSYVYGPRAKVKF
jgi:hypothetical protein